MPPALDHRSQPLDEESTESMAFREAIAYMRGVADAVSVYERETLAAPARATEAPAPVTSERRRITLPYGGPEAATFADERIERASGIRLKSAIPSSDLYDLAGVERKAGP